MIKQFLVNLYLYRERTLLIDISEINLNLWKQLNNAYAYNNMKNY